MKHVKFTFSFDITEKDFNTEECKDFLKELKEYADELNDIHPNERFKDLFKNRQSKIEIK